MTQASNTNIEPEDPGDRMVAVRIKGEHWKALTGEGLEIPRGRLHLVRQKGETVAGWPTYGIEIVQ